MKHYKRHEPLNLKCSDLSKKLRFTRWRRNSLKPFRFDASEGRIDWFDICRIL